MTWALILAFARKNWQAILAAVLIAVFVGWGLRGYSKAKSLHIALDKQVQAMLSSTHVTPPSLDEFFERHYRTLRVIDFAALGWKGEEY